MTTVYLYDTTLRDGVQREGLSFSVGDKLKILLKLDELGVHFVEGGWPGSNPRDQEFFRRASQLKLRNTTLASFGATRRPRSRAEDDPNLQALVEAGAPVATLVGKSWDLHATLVLDTSLEENLAMISDSVAFLKARGLRVFFDAEHFFDGYKANPAYALHTLEAAAGAGAEWVVLCDTNGGSLPHQVREAVEKALKVVSVPVGIHAHNDSELAVANTLVAVSAGATQVQGTINGYGERCGNANLCSLIPNLKLKMGLDCITPERLARLTEVSRFVSELANIAPDSHLPYVGASAFAHKAGLHVSGLMKREESYQHIDPSLVGNAKRVLVSELSGKSNIVYKLREKGLELPPGRGAKEVLERIKSLESLGFQFDGAEASFELLVHRAHPDYHPPFELVDFMVVVERRRRPPQQGDGELLAEAMVKVRVGDEVMHTVAEGNGPVNALDLALRKALVPAYPQVAGIKLVDYKVRILEESAGTGASVRVLIESSDGPDQWRTVGSSANIIEASWLALVDSLEYHLWKKGVLRAKP
ncbi:MAG: citramalate synthase [Chloroflexota bacterium]